MNSGESMRNMYEVMEHWGAWVAAENSGLDWQQIAAGFKGLIPYAKKSRPQCTDDIGLTIDFFVSILCKRRPDMYGIIIAHFVMRVSLRAIARQLKCSDGTIRKKVESALGFIEGCWLSRGC